MSRPTPLHIRTAIEWLLLAAATAGIAWLTVGLSPGEWRSSASEAGFNLRPFGNLRFIVSQARGGKLFTPKVAYEVLSILGNIGLFWCWAFLALHAFSRAGKRSIETVVWVILLGVAFSAGIESLQVFLPERAADVDDVLANGTGAILGAVHGWLRRGVSIDWA